MANSALQVAGAMKTDFGAKTAMLIPVVCIGASHTDGLVVEKRDERRIAKYRETFD